MWQEHQGSTLHLFHEGGMGRKPLTEPENKGMSTRGARMEKRQRGSTEVCKCDWKKENGTSVRVEATKQEENVTTESGLRDVLMLVSDVDFLKDSLRECERRVQPMEEARDGKDLTFYPVLLLMDYFHGHVSFN